MPTYVSVKYAVHSEEIGSVYTPPPHPPEGKSSP